MSMPKDSLRSVWLFTSTKYQNLNSFGKSLVWIFILFHVAFFAFLIIYTPSGIFQSLYDLSQKLKAMPFGWLLLGGVMIALSFPPLAGYSTCTTLCGFAYGIEGFFIAGPATLVGSGLAFLVLRRLFHHQLKRWSTQNDKWRALEQIIKARGLPLIVLIRVSPFPPYVYSQALFASISCVGFWQFMLATVFYLSRILLSVFIGSRIAAFADKSRRLQMDSSTKLINGLSIAVGIALGVGLAWYLYWTVNRRIQEAQEQYGLRPSDLAGETIEDIPLLEDDNTLRHSMDLQGSSHETSLITTERH